MSGETTAPSSSSTGRLFTFRSGGWVLALAGAVSLAILAWALAGALFRTGGPLVGDGENVASYGFDLSTCLVDRELLVAGQMRKDALVALVDPPVLAGAGVAALNEQMRGKYLVSRDLVLGVEVAGAARAYPIRVLNVHEVVNDTLGGEPVLVTYNPLCGAAAVFERPLGGPADQEAAEFGVSGLLYNSNLLVYDRRPGAVGESLWSQLQARAIAGPAAAEGRRLRRLPCALVTWGDWLAAHPETTVLQPDARLLKRYKETDYAAYARSRELLFPVEPMPGPGDPPVKERVIIVRTAGGAHAYTFAEIREAASATGVWRDDVGPARLIFAYGPEPETVRVTSEPPAAIESVTYCYWFAANAMGLAEETAD